MNRPIKTCWIHVGMHKTGTTSLQKSLSLWNDIPGWAYLTLGRYVNLGVPLHAMFASNPMKYHWFKKRGQSHPEVRQMGASWRAELAQFAQSRESDNLLISAEGVSLVDKDGIARMRDFLLGLAEEIRVVGVVRPPVGFASSMFQQHLKFGLGRFDLKKTAPRYRERFEKFDEVFGRERVDLWKFDPAAFPNGCLVTDFCQRLGIPMPKNRTIIRANESLSRTASSMLYSYYKHGPGYGQGPRIVKENRALINALFEIQGSKFVLSQHLIAERLQHHADDIKWMEERLGQPLLETGADPADAIMSEDDLLTIAPGSSKRFTNVFPQTSGVVLPDDMASRFDDTPEGVAALMEECRNQFRVQVLKHPSEGVRPGNSKVNTMKLNDTVASVKAEHPDSLGKISEKEAILLVRTAFEQIGAEIDQAEVGDKLRIPVLGTIVVKPMPQNKDGESKKRLILRRPTPKVDDPAA